jgi:hypothetical protein
LLFLIFLLISPFIPFFIVFIIWHYWSKDKIRVEKLRKQEITIKRKLKRLVFKEEAPFGEIRYPLMLITISSVFFVLITAGFGVAIDTRDGGTIFSFDTDQYFNEDDGALQDPWMNRPMEQFINKNATMVFLIMYMGYCFMLCFLVYIWFEYCKWKWEHIPIEKKYMEVKLKP